MICVQKIVIVVIPQDWKVQCLICNNIIIEVWGPLAESFENIIYLLSTYWTFILIILKLIILRLYNDL